MEASIVPSLRKKLSCSICFKVYIQPKLLHCLHSFCLPCLNKMASSQRGHGAPPTLQCPECRADMQLAQGCTPESLPNSVHYQRLSELLVIKSRQRAATACSCCERNRLPHSFCFDCAGFVCSECLAAHKLLNSIKGHRNVVLDEFQESDVDELFRRPSTCTVAGHKGETLAFLCADCQACICQRGAVAEHKNHRLVPIAKASEECARAAGQVALSVKERIPVVQDAMRKMADQLRSTKEQVEAARGQVHDQVEAWIGALRKHEASVQSELDSVLKNEQLRYEEERKTKEARLLQLRSTAEFVDGVTKRSLLVEVMHTHHWIVKRCTQLSSTKDDDEKTRQISVKYVANQEHCVTRSRVTPGRLLVTDVTRHVASNTPRPTVHANAYAPHRTFGCKGSGKGQLSFPWGIAVNSKLEVAVADSGNHRIQLFTAEGNHLGCLGRRGNTNGEFKFPQGLAFDGQGQIIVADTSNSRLQVLTTRGEFVRAFGTGELHLPWGVCTTDDGHIAVCSGGGNPGVKVFTPEGALLMQFNDRRRKSRPYYVAYASDKYFVSYGKDRVVVVFDKVGRPLHTIGGCGLGPGQLLSPYGLLIDKNNNLLVCDFANDCIQEFTVDGRFVDTLAVAKSLAVDSLQKPLDLALSPSGAELFVSENGANRVHILGREERP